RRGRPGGYRSDPRYGPECPGDDPTLQRGRHSAVGSVGESGHATAGAGAERAGLRAVSTSMETVWDVYVSCLRDLDPGAPTVLLQRGVSTGDLSSVERRALQPPAVALGAPVG